VSSRRHTRLEIRLEANSKGLSEAAADAERWWEESERECQERVQEHTLLQTWGSELCQAIVGPLRLRSHMSKGMRIAALCHTEMAEQLALLRVLLSSVGQSVHGRSPTEAL
jgi:hypothetical protein